MSGSAGPGNRGRKRAHSLGMAANAGDFLGRLSAEGVDLAGLVTSRLVPGRTAAVLLTGSLAEGTSTPQSDVDILVLVESFDDLDERDGDLRLSTGKSRELLVYVNGIELNLEFVARDAMMGLLEDFIALAPALYDPKRVERFSILERFDLRFLHRLKTGWPLMDTALTDRWRDEFAVDLLPKYLVMRYYFEFCELLEDVQSFAAHGSPDFPHSSRLCAEAAVATLLATEGITTQSRKHFVSLTRVIPQRLRPLVDRALEAMFPPRTMTATQLEAQVTALVALGDALDDELRQDRELGRGLAYLAAEISYATPDEPAARVG